MNKPREVSHKLIQKGMKKAKEDLLVGFSQFKEAEAKFFDVVTPLP